MPSKAGFPIFSSTSPARIALLQGLLIAAIVVTALYVGREVLVPLALAILLSFVLTPPLLFLRRLRVPRVLGVATLVSAAFLIILAIGWLISREAAQLAIELPRYQSTLTEKISKITRSAADAPAIGKVMRALEEFDKSLRTQAGHIGGDNARSPEQVGENRKPVPVEFGNRTLGHLNCFSVWPARCFHRLPPAELFSCSSYYSSATRGLARQAHSPVRHL